MEENNEEITELGKALEKKEKELKGKNISELTKNLDEKRRAFKEKENQVTELRRDLDFSRKESNAKKIKIITALREDVKMKKGLNGQTVGQANRRTDNTK